MNQREAKRIREEDDTPYGVLIGDGGLALIHVSGYANAKVVAGRKSHRLILTKSEIDRFHADITYRQGVIAMTRSDTVWS
jgi:hypothetical protein